MKPATQGDRVLIAGGGVVGIACAHYLQEAGLEVTVVDQAGVAEACSHGNCGYICPSHVLPLTEPGAFKVAIKSLFQPNAPFRVKPRLSPALWNWMFQFARRCTQRQMLDAGKHLKAILDSSMQEYRGLIASHSLDCEWKENGLLYVLRTPSGLRDFAHIDQILKEHFDVAAKHIDGADLPSFDAALKPGLAGAYWYPGDTSVRPDKLNRNWANLLRSKGVKFIEGCHIDSVDCDEQSVRSLQTSQGALTADHFVFALGARSPIFAKQLGCRIPIEPGKGYSVTMRRPEVCPTHPMLFPEHKVGVTPFDNGYRLGSMMEFAGYDESIPERRIEQLRRSAEPYLQEPYTDDVEEKWYGWRPMTWDSLPIVGRTPRRDNAVLATGHNMLGLSLAAGTGRLVKEILFAEPTHIDIAAFAPERFQ